MARTRTAAVPGVYADTEALPVQPTTTTVQQALTHFLTAEVAARRYTATTRHT
ncbi:MAG: hypothetical protein ACRDID_07445 [Ktedonobacterales bacterium]